MKHKRDEEKAKGIKETVQKLKKRENSENKRFKRYYGYDCYDKSVYDEVIDTTNMTIEDVSNKIYKLIKKTLEKKAV